MNAFRRRQQGATLLALIAGLALGTAWFVMNRVEHLNANRTAASRAHNAEVLKRAKAALIGYVAAQAGKQYEDYPGAIPCPEAAGYFDNATQEGQAAGTCTLPKIGRFPWRTIGTEKLVDAAGEPLWFVVSENWGYGTSTTRPVVNSNSIGQLTVDGVANAAVALIIAPGAAINAASATNCTAVSQARPTTGSPSVSNYLECQNAAAGSSYVTTGPSASFNDQVMVVTAADLLPGIEAAIAKRIETEIAPVLKAVYASTDWGSGVGLSQPVYPFAAPFDNPTTSTYRGSAGTYAGLLPFHYTAASCGGDARCSTSTSLHSWSTPTVTKTSGTADLWPSLSCTLSSSSAYCYGYYYSGTVALTYDDRVANIANTLRTFSLSSYTTQVRAYNYNNGNWTTVIPTARRQFNSDGSFSFVLSASFPNVGGWGLFEFTTARPTFSDHALLSSTDDTTGWFVRNEWYRLVYYVVAQGHTGTSTPACTTATTCVSVSNLTPSGAQRALLILAGRSINGGSRPSSALTDYLEYGNATGKYEKRTVSPVTVSATPYSDTGTANAYTIAATSLTVGRAVYFRAANTNTGASTLTVPGFTGARPILNEDGSALTAGQIPANGLVHVTYDGTGFVLRKTPYNDRIIVVDANT